MQPLTGSLLPPTVLRGLHPTAVLDEIAVVGLGVDGIKIEGVDPCGGDVQSRKSKRSLMKQEFLKTVDFTSRNNIVHHGKQHTSHGVSEWNGFAELTAVDANGMHLIWVNVTDVLDGVRGAVLTVLHSDFVQMTKASKNERPCAFKMHLCVQPVHDFVAETHRLHERLRGLGRLDVRDRPVVLQTEKEFPRL